MGKRGKGAKPAPKQKKSNAGRPRNQGYREAVLAAWALVPQAFEELARIIADEKAERSHKLRASERITSTANMPIADDEPKADEKSEEPISTVFQDDWRAPAE